MLFKRWLDLPGLLQKKSHFLFGPRSTGKTFLIKSQFPHSTAILDLLESELYLRLSTNPGDLESIISAFDDRSITIIDQVQRVPQLLNEVHRLIEKRSIK